MPHLSFGLANTVNKVWDDSPARVIIHDMGRVVTLDRRIRQLCDQAVAAKEPDVLQRVMKELRKALREHNEELELMVAEYPFLLDDLGKPAA